MAPELHGRFTAAVEAALAGATVVTATTRAARKLLAESLRRLRAEKAACRTPDILPLEAFYQRLWGDALAAGAATEALLSEHRAHALWRKVIASSRHSGALSAHGSARMAQDAWRTAQAYRIPLEARAFRGVAECAAFFEWASLYKEECGRGGWGDATVLPAELVRRVDQIVSILPRHLVLYGLDPLTPQTSDFCRALSGHNVRVETISIDANLAHTARTIAAADINEELRLPARWARGALLEDSSCRIGIVLPGLREICNLAEAAFAEILHPEEFLSPGPNPDRIFEIAAGRPLDEYALVHHALLTLRFAFAELPISDVSILLRSPYVGQPGEAPGRALFDVALRKNGRAQYSAQTLPAAAGERSRVAAPQDFARRVRQLANLRTPQTKLLKPSDAAEQFHNALVAANWPARQLDSTEYQLREKWEDLLGEFASLDGFVPPQTAPALVDELARMAAAAPFRPENSGAPVQIMDEDEAAGCAFDRLWVCGLSDDWPRPSRPNPYLPLASQRAAGVPNLTPAEQHASAVAALARFTASANEVVLSWARQDGERELRASHLLQDFEPADPAGLSGPPAPICASIQRATAELEYLDDQKAPAADPAALPHSGTDVLKYQAHCPFRAFAQLRLGAEQLESPELGLDRRVRGKLVETALQAFWTEVRNSDNLCGLLPEQRVAEIIDTSVEKAFQEHWREIENAWNERLRTLERRRLQSLLTKWCDVELKRAPFEVLVDEQQKQIEVALGTVKIHARIDRVDRVRGGGFVVIDYKAGRVAPRPADWGSDRPEEPQLPLYVVHQLDQDREVSAVAFAHVSAADLSWKGYATNTNALGLKADTFKRHFKTEKFEEHIRWWRPNLERLANDFLSGKAKVDPKHPPTGSTSTCDRCHLQALCRVAEASFAVTENDGAEPGGDDE